jgi:5-enolpyruvylshikimate-3-phosphate synthase
VRISPTLKSAKEVPTFIFDSAGDHRMVMAGQVLRQVGYSIQILGEESVRKSFPEFLHFIESAPSTGASL